MLAPVKDVENIEFLEKLSFLVFESARYKVAYGGRGAGKCLAVGTKVIMADGSLRNVEDVIAGDSVMGPDSLPRKVLGTTRGISQMYKIHQSSGMDYVVNSAHILSLKKSKSAKKDKGLLSKAGNYRRPNGRYGEYPDVTNINVVEAYQQSKRWQDHFRGYRAGLLHFAERDIGIDPWYLGAWLGDGKSSDTILYSEDAEVLAECDRLADELGLRVSIYEQPNNKSIGIKLARYDGTQLINPLRQVFSAYELFDNKHIPEDFKINSEEIRLEVLAGLLDTDGYCYNNGYEIIQTNKVLADDIKFLADSLGFRTYLREKKTVCSNNGVEGLAYRLSINGDTWRIPCRIARKQVKKENVNKNKDFLLSQIKIEPVGMGEYAGFSLDGDHLFCLEDGTVTHNTEGFAIALILLCRAKKLRILCLREIQNSIEESIKATLEANIEAMGLSEEFKILDKKIICLRTGSEFLFYGLRYNINKIKSLGRIDIAWVEEAINVSKTSWEKLGPTIRGRSVDDPTGLGGPFGKGPEIWISFNPELDTDETYKRFILKRERFYPDWVVVGNDGEVLLDAQGHFITEMANHPSAVAKVRYAIVTKINYTDNKFFPPDLRLEMSVTKAANEDDYLEVWEGNTKQVLAGAVYADEIRQVLKDGRRGVVRYDPSKPVYTFWDLGHSDKTAIWFIQRAGLEYNVINFYQNNLKKLSHYLEHMQSLGYVYGTVYMPHDADNETLASRSIASMTREVYKVIVVQRPSRKLLGINAARTVFPLCNFDEDNTSEGWQCLTRYAYKVDDKKETLSREPDHDTPWSHGADAFQTFALSLKTEQDSKKLKPKLKLDLLPARPNAWMGNL